MLSRLFGECCTRETCPRTPADDFKLVKSDIERNGYSIRTYPETHPLYDYYNNRVQQNARSMSGIMCRGQLSPQYIQGVQESFPMLTIARMKKDDSVVWRAFVQSAVRQTLEGKTELHIHTLCAAKDSKLGAPVLKSVQDFVKKTVKYDMVLLDSVPDAVGFYEKQGFIRVFPKEGEKDTTTVPMIKGGLRLKTIRKSHKKEKKWDAVFDKDGKEKIVPFGQKGYSDYTKHRDKTRRQRYIDRHSGMGENWRDPATPGALSRYVLWNKKTIRASVSDFKKRFHV
jgi:hypothetical protein